VSVDGESRTAGRKAKMKKKDESREFILITKPLLEKTFIRLSARTVRCAEIDRIRQGMRYHASKTLLFQLPGFVKQE
jgi:hypothetical protein